MKNVFLILLTLLHFVLCISMNCFAEEGITDTEIRIAQFGPLTGPAASWGAVLQGSAFLFHMINEQGGIYGRKITYFILDDSYNPARTKQLVKEYQENIGIFAWGPSVGTEPCLGVKNYLSRRNIPWIGPLAEPTDFTQPPDKCIFTFLPTYSSQSKVLTRYAIENMGKRRLAFIYQNDGYGKSGLEGAKNELSKYKMSLAAEIPIESQNTSFKTYIKQLNEAEIDAVILFTTPFCALRLVKTAFDMEYVTQWMGPVHLGDFSLFYSLSNGLWKGVITIQMGDVNQASSIKEYQRALSEYANENGQLTMLFYSGIGLTEPLVEALKRCGRNLTRERFIKELEGLQTFSPRGNPASFKPFNINDPECRRGLKAVYLAQGIEDGKMKRLTDWIKVD